MEGITLITGPRTGAGHLLALLRNFEAVAPRDGLFAEGGDVSAQLEAAEREAEAAHQRLLVLKATSALPREVVDRTLLSRPGMRAIFVVRRPIDAYVSLAKATVMNAWRDTDLTAVKVKLDASHFATWLAEQEAWYAHWKSWLERRAFPLPVLRYEAHLNVPPDAVLRRFIAAAAQIGITLRMPATLPFEGHKKQDRERAAAQRVKNWSEFSRRLTEMDIEKRAFGYPI